MITSWPCFQLAGVATLCLAVSWMESSTPLVVEGIPLASRVAAGSRHACALTTATGGLPVRLHAYGV